MKIVFVVLCSLFTCSSFAQEQYNRVLFSQLMVIFSDLENHFDYLKGDLKTKEGSVAFYETNRTLNGTKDNMIAIDSSTSQYVAIVNDSTSEENSKHILALWKEKLMNALTGMFTAPSEFYSKKMQVPMAINLPQIKLSFIFFVIKLKTAGTGLISL